VSRVADIILIVGPGDDHNVERLSFWMASDEALDDDAAEGRVGSLLSLTAGGSEQRWGGFKAPTFSAWGAVANHLHWGRFLERVAATPWDDRARVQLLMKDDGDTCFRLYLFQVDELSNVAPVPEDEGYDRAW
jgi:hypothetical protein